MSEVSSQDLHPKAGARFVFERQGEAMSYRVLVYLPDSRMAQGSLSWDDSGSATLELEPEPTGDDQWIVQGVLKLARVLKRDPKAWLSRWREG